MEHIVVIGGGTGGALAHDLILRGFRVTLVEKGALLSGTSGRHHGLLHSGARYVLHDVKTAYECAEENRILRRIAPDALELNDGLFVALNDADMALWDRFGEKCREARIPNAPLSASQTLDLEPELVPTLKGAFRVCDATMDAWRLPLQFFATALSNGARIRTFTEVLSIQISGRSIVGVEVIDHRFNRVETIGSDLVVNAAGPWAAKVAAMAGLQIPLRMVPGVMVSVPARLNRMVINRLHPAGEGDIIVPQRNLSILGTTAWTAEDPDAVQIPPDHVTRLFELGKRLIPSVTKYAAHSVWHACRPLLDAGPEQDPMRISRTSDCLDHAEHDDLEGFVTVLGGKATTMRAMAEQTADLICRKTGRDRRCRTREVMLKPYRAYYEYH
jgi:glycerol-3-phosphate dehydrogenase